MDIPLSASDIESAVPEMRVMKYGELEHLGHLPERPFTVLYETSPNYGHWVAVIDTPEGIEHFDPYGIIPDNEFRWIPKGFRNTTGQNVKHLISMFLSSGLPINYNPHRLQGPKSSTCGRWAILRARMSEFGNDDFVRAVRTISKKFNVAPDKLVVDATSDA